MWVGRGTVLHIKCHHVSRDCPYVMYAWQWDTHIESFSLADNLHVCKCLVKPFLQSIIFVTWTACLERYRLLHIVQSLVHRVFLYVDASPFWVHVRFMCLLLCCNGGSKAFLFVLSIPCLHWSAVSYEHVCAHCRGQAATQNSSSGGRLWTLVSSQPLCFCPLTV